MALNDRQLINYVKVSDIVYFKADGAYTIFYLLNAQKIMVSKILKNMKICYQTLAFHAPINLI